MCPFYVERFLKLPSSRGVLRRLRSAGENLAAVCRRQTKLRRKLCQVGGGIGIIKRVHDGYHVAAACRSHESWDGGRTRPDYGEASAREQQLDIGVGPDSDISGALDIRLGRNHFTPGRPMLGKAGIC